MEEKVINPIHTRTKQAISLESFIILGVIIAFTSYFANVVGTSNMFNIVMKTAYSLLINTCFFILAIATLAGAICGILTEYGIVSILNIILSPLMRPLYKLPGAASIAILTSYLSDNPAIIPIAKDEKITKYFKDYELPAITNLGTAFGMGLILSTYMIALNDKFIVPVIVGNIGAFIGSIVAVRIMLYKTKKYYAIKDERKYTFKDLKKDFLENYKSLRDVNNARGFERLLNSILEGGKSGVQMGISIIPGVLFFCTLIIILTNGASAIDPQTGRGIYHGVANEGIALLPKFGKIISPITNILFGFTSPEAISFPITSLGAVGAAMGLVPGFLKKGLIGPNDIAVFTAMGMCYSGYLSTHVGMMDALNRRFLTMKAIFSQTIGGLCAGIAAHYIYLFITKLF